ncbi:MAG: A24 family peptidase [Candidatus Anstonellales archaeon]
MMDLFAQYSIPFEGVRIAVAILMVGIGTYFDLFKNKNVPDKFLYACIGIAFLFAVFPFNDLSVYALAQGIFIFAIGYMMYKAGQIGGADVYLLSAIAMLIPVPPSITGITMAVPFIFFVIIFSGLIFTAYNIVYFIVKLSHEKITKIDWVYLILAIPFAIFAYFYSNSIFYSPIYFSIITILFVGAVVFGAFRETIMKHAVVKVPVGKAEEEVFASEYASERERKIVRVRVIDKKTIEELKKAKIKEITVYGKLPPFLPFVFVGVLLSLFFANLLFPDIILP